MADLPIKPTFSRGFVPENRLAPGHVQMTNSDGDVVEMAQVTIRCQGCTREFSGIIHPHTPVRAKFKCRFCGYTTECKTRKESMDDVEELIAIGMDQRKEPTPTVYTGPALKIHRTGKQTVHVPGLGKATLIGGK